MSFIALSIALVLEQWRPLADRRAVLAPLAAYVRLLERYFDAGEAQQGAIAWALAVGPIVAASWALYAALTSVHPVLGIALNILALYATMGFSAHSHYFNEIHAALKAGDIETAQRLLAEWREHPCDALSPSEVARLAIESALIAAHRHVFGVVFWFVVLPGPIGAVLYRMALFLDDRWGEAGRGGRLGLIVEGPGVDARLIDRQDAEEDQFGVFARQAFYALDWLPVRVTAASFAIVGDFEDAVYCWRTQAARWPDRLLGIILAAGAGALGVRLGAPIARSSVIEDRPELGLGEDADMPLLDSTIGLIWRALSLWLVLLLVLSLARALG